MSAWFFSDTINVIALINHSLLKLLTVSEYQDGIRQHRLQFAAICSRFWKRIRREWSTGCPNAGRTRSQRTLHLSRQELFHRSSSRRPFRGGRTLKFTGGQWRTQEFRRRVEFQKVKILLAISIILYSFSCQGRIQDFLLGGCQSAA